MSVSSDPFSSMNLNQVFSQAQQLVEIGRKAIPWEPFVTVAAVASVGAAAIGAATYCYLQVQKIDNSTC